MKVKVYHNINQQEEDRYLKALTNNNELKEAEINVDENYKQVVIEFDNDEYIDILELINKLEQITEDGNVYILVHNKDNELAIEELDATAVAAMMMEGKEVKEFEIKDDFNHLHIYIKTNAHNNTIYSIVNNIKKIDKDELKEELETLKLINFTFTNNKQTLKQKRKNMAQVLVHVNSVNKFDGVVPRFDKAMLESWGGYEVEIGTNLSGYSKKEVEKLKNKEDSRIPLEYEFHLTVVSMSPQERQNLVNALKNRFGNDITILKNNNKEIVFKIKNYKIVNNVLKVRKKELLFLDVLKVLEDNNTLVINMQKDTELMFKNINRLQEDLKNISYITANPISKSYEQVEKRLDTILLQNLEKYKNKLKAGKVKDINVIKLYENVIEQIEKYLKQKGLIKKEIEEEQIEQQKQEETEQQETKEEIKVEEQQKEEKEEVKEIKQINIEDLDDEELKKQVEELDKEIEVVNNLKNIDSNTKQQLLKDLETKRINTYNKYLEKVKENLQKQIEEKTKEIESLKQNNEKLNNEIKQVDEELNELLKVFDEKYENIEDFKQALIQKTSKFNNLIDRFNKKLDELDNKLKEAYKKEEELKKQLKEKEEVIKNKEEEIIKQKESYEKTITTLKEEITNRNEEIKQKNEEIKNFNNKIKTIINVNNKVKEIMTSKNLTIEEKLEQLKQLKEQYKNTEIKDIINITFKELETIIKLKEDNNIKEKQIDELKKQTKEKNEEIETLKYENKELKEENEQLRKDVDKLYSVIDEKTNEIKLDEEEIKELKKELKEVKKEIENKDKEIEELKELVKEAKELLEEFLEEANLNKKQKETYKQIFNKFKI